MSGRSASSPPRVQRLAGGAALQLGGKAAGRGSGFLAHMLLARVLGPALYGVFGVGWTIFQLVSLTASLGLEHGAVRYASRHLGRDPERLAGVLRRSLILALGSGLLFAAGLALAAPLLARRVFSMPALAPVLLGLAAGVVLAVGTRVAAAATRVSQRMRYSTLAEDLVLPVGHLLLLAVFLAIGWRLAAGVAAPVLAQALAFAVALGALRLLFPAVSSPVRAAEPSTGRLLGFSISAALSGLLGMLTILADRLLVGIYLPEAQAGIYVAASQIALLFAVVLSALNTVLAPMVAELHGRGEVRQLESLYRTCTRWGLYLTTPLFLVVLAFPADVLALLGEGFAPGAVPLAILAAGQMANLGTGAVGLILVMSGRQNRLLTLSALALGTNVVLNVLWIPRYGLAGAALATALSLGALFSAALATVRKSPGVWPYDRRLLKGALATVAAGGGLAALRLVAPRLTELPGGAVWLPAAAVLTAYGLFAALLTLTGLDQEDRDLLDRLTRSRSVRG